MALQITCCNSRALVGWRRDRAGASGSKAHGKMLSLKQLAGDNYIKDGLLQLIAVVGSSMSRDVLAAG